MFSIVEILAAIIGISLPQIFRLYENIKQDKALQDNIIKAENNAKEEPTKAKPAWDLARITLESYFKKNLSQVASIFWLSALVLLSGFIIICWGVFNGVEKPEKFTPAAIATLSGIIMQFIGGTFLFLYKSIMQQATDYAKTLERINAVGMTMQILDTMPDKIETNDLKSHTKAKIVEILIAQSVTKPSAQADHATPQKPLDKVDVHNKKKELEETH